MKQQNLLHHLTTGIGFIFLIFWFYIGKYLGFLDWCIQLAPTHYEGAALMLGIGLLMTPAFFIWSRGTRIVERKLKIKGTYYEDTYYGENNSNQLKSRDDSK